MPVTSATKTVLKSEVIEADGWEVVDINVHKPVTPDERDPVRIRIVWGCTLAGEDISENVEVNLEGKEAVDYMGSIPMLYADLLTEATALGKAHEVLPVDVV